jgi:hypothetical protein
LIDHGKGHAVAQIEDLLDVELELVERAEPLLEAFAYRC